MIWPVIGLSGVQCVTRFYAWKQINPGPSSIVNCVSVSSSHKCLAERRKPLQDQEGAVQCSRCDRWFASRGGLSVHRCGCAPPCLQPTSLPEPESTRHALVDQPCCHFHCSTCDRCFKSSPGFSRHNCLRLKSRMSVDRSSFSFVCSDCGRRFRRKQDLTRHKCC